MSGSAKRIRNALLWVAPLPAMALGALAAASHGVRWTAFAPNLGGALIGALLVAVATRAKPATIDTAARVLPVVASVGIAATLFAAGLDGVHRWVAMGHMRLNVSVALAPWLFLGFLSSSRRVRGISLALVGYSQLMHFAQPDASQASALAVGMLPILIGGSFVDRRVGLPASALLIGLAAATWARPDPLGPVAHVEGVLSLITSMGIGWTALAAFSGAALLAPFVLAMCTGDVARLQLAAGLGIYLGATFVATLFGYFPVPVFGAGAGPVLGWYELAAALGYRGARDARARPAPGPRH